MSTRRLVALLALGALAGPLVADVPDGRGGRTSPQAAPKPVVAASAPHACCPRASTALAARPSSPAEVKALGEIAWQTRYGVMTIDAIPCYKMATVLAHATASAAELKAIGHARKPARIEHASTECCASAKCPMRARS